MKTTIMDTMKKAASGHITTGYLSEAKQVVRTMILLAVSAVISIMICGKYGTEEGAVKLMNGISNLPLWLSIPAVIILAFVVLHFKDKFKSHVVCCGLEISMAVMFGIAMPLAFLANRIYDSYAFMITSILFLASYLLVTKILNQKLSNMAELLISVAVSFASFCFIAYFISLSGYGIVLGINGIVVSVLVFLANNDYISDYKFPLYALASFVLGAVASGLMILFAFILIGMLMLGGLCGDLTVSSDNDDCFTDNDDDEFFWYGWFHHWW